MNSEHGATRSRRLGAVESCDRSGGRQVDGEAAVVAEALEAVVFPFLLSEPCCLLRCLG